MSTVELEPGAWTGTQVRCEERGKISRKNLMILYICVGHGIRYRPPVHAREDARREPSAGHRCNRAHRSRRGTPTGHRTVRYAHGDTAHDTSHDALRHHSRRAPAACQHVRHGPAPPGCRSQRRRLARTLRLLNGRRSATARAQTPRTLLSSAPPMPHA